MGKNKYDENCSDVVCSVDYAFKRIGGKYKGRILWNLSNKNILRYGELRKTLVDVTPKMLTQTLRELEDDELVSRKVYHEVPPKVEYSLTDIGMELIPFINHLKEWGDKQRAKEKISSSLRISK
ncbi:helix-turn-helix domain-containing protein [Flavobacterium sp. ENC]|uniref:winged helix-turn-helix transcriptional regulator n=1 Tax=Flavobacterium sp. ENC TaxID=2897330 RepID=UPI001E5D7F26|nr:helix-turn-helix domain-containing protein [Flavobacterium sp. ENC]MCD0466663.1 helix-turn-helix transcriptional regulator [Flavobacterium sp. ENC]